MDGNDLIVDGIVRDGRQPSYDKHFSIVEGHLGDLPAGSYFQRLASGYCVRVARSTGKGGWMTFKAEHLGDAYWMAIEEVNKESKR